MHLRLWIFLQVSLLLHPCVSITSTACDHIKTHFLNATSLLLFYHSVLSIFKFSLAFLFNMDLTWKYDFYFPKIISLFWTHSTKLKRYEKACSEKSSMEIPLKKLVIKLSYNLAIPLLDIHPEKIIVQEDTCTPVFIAALSTIARPWKQPTVQRQINGK